jgi:hypothetical protein
MMALPISFVRSSGFLGSLFVVLALSAPASGWSQTYMGKVCMLVTVTERQTGAVSEPQRAIELDVTNLGGNTYAVAGAMATPPDQPFVVTGSGTIVGGELYLNMTATLTHSDGWMDTGINQTRLNLANLSGTFYEIGHDFNRPGRIFDNSRFSAGTATLSLTGCS